MNSATNLRRKTFDSCKLSVLIWLLGAFPQTPTGAPPLDPVGGTSVPRPPVPLPTLTSKPGYATGACAQLMPICSTQVASAMKVYSSFS